MRQETTQFRSAAARVATIRALENALTLPAVDGYDRQLVLQAAQSFARRHGASTLIVGSQRVQLVCGTLPPPCCCKRCGQAVKGIVYKLESKLLCSHCMQRGVGWGTPRRPLKFDPAARNGKARTR